MAKPEMTATNTDAITVSVSLHGCKPEAKGLERGRWWNRADRTYKWELRATPGLEARQDNRARIDEAIAKLQEIRSWI